VEKTIAFVETKWTPMGGSRGVAFAPRVSYEFENGVFGFDLPIYLLLSKADDKGNQSFVGGLRLGWRDDDDKFVAGIFVGKKFDLTE
jgi:hypothetical protein